jgi:ribonucleoside-diphosphate reductase beta chain
MIVEGVLAETGYQAYSYMLERSDLFPGQRKGIGYVRQDESRHIAYGVFLLSRLLAEDDSLWGVIESRMNTLLIPAVGVVREVFSRYDPVPFGLVEDELANYAMMQFQKRLERILKARGASLDEVSREAYRAIEQDDA